MEDGADVGSAARPRPPTPASPPPGRPPGTGRGLRSRGAGDGEGRTGRPATRAAGARGSSSRDKARPALRARPRGRSSFRILKTNPHLAFKDGSAFPCSRTPPIGRDSLAPEEAEPPLPFPQPVRPRPAAIPGAEAPAPAARPQRAGPARPRGGEAGPPPPLRASEGSSCPWICSNFSPCLEVIHSFM